MLVLAVGEGAGPPEAVLLQEPDGGGVVLEGVGVQGPYRLAPEEQREGTAADAAPPVVPAEPVADESPVAVPPGAEVSGDFTVHGDGLHQAVRVAENTLLPVPDEPVPGPGRESGPPYGLGIMLVGEERLEIGFQHIAQLYGVVAHAREHGTRH